MSLEFRSILDPAPDIVAQIANLTPDNPFSTVEYLEVRKRLGAEGCAITILSENSPITGCLAFITRGRLNSRMEVTSLPVLHDQKFFWNSLFGFCRDQGISVLSTHTFGSTETSIAETNKRTSTKRRSEYRLDLTVPDLWAIMTRRHHRLIKKGRSAGLVVRSTNDPSSRETHVSLANMSLERRRGKGEPINSRIEMDDVNAFLDCGAGEIIQAVIGDEVHATMLLARSKTGGYAQSSGTSTVGRNIGSSHFLFYEVACLLKAAGGEVFNLGGADEHSTGLQDFKLGLGSTRIDLESAEFYTGSPLKKFATGAIGLLKGVTLPI